MRVLFLGAGAVGTAAAEVAATLPEVTGILLADRSPARSEAAGLEVAGLEVARLDITDARALQAALGQVDAVVNTVGPYYRFGTRVLRAAIDAGVHYLDVCDDWEPTAELLALDARARAAGVRAVVGIGASPGVSNLLAVLAARELDAVQDVYTAWPVDVAPPAGEDLDGAAAVHWMRQLSGTIAVVEGGRETQRPPLRQVRLDLPGGRSGTAYTVGHPEPVTLRTTLRPAGKAATLMVVTPGTAAYLDVLRRDLDAGRLTLEEAAADLARPTVLRALRAWKLARKLPGPGTLPPFFAVATAEDATAAAFLEGPPADMARATGTPLALALAQLPAVPPGVHPPETALAPEPFFAAMAARLPDVRVRVETSRTAISTARTCHQQSSRNRSWPGPPTEPEFS